MLYRLLRTPLRVAPWFVLFSVSLASQSATASLLTGGLNVDNGFVAYLSTDDTVAGTQLAAGNNWGATIGFSNVALNAGQDYFLHVLGYDQGWIAGFLGEFSLSGGDHLFANGTEHLLTNSQDWIVSTSGWGNYVAATSLGSNGSWPWGSRPGVDANAQWIWSSDPYNHDRVYFSTAISANTPNIGVSAVPAPSTLLLLSAGLLGLAWRRRRGV